MQTNRICNACLGELGNEYELFLLICFLANKKLRHRLLRLGHHFDSGREQKGQVLSAFPGMVERSNFHTLNQNRDDSILITVTTREFQCRQL